MFPWHAQDFIQKNKIVIKKVLVLKIRFLIQFTQRVKKPRKEKEKICAYRHEI